VRRLDIHVTAHTPATAAVVYALLAEGASWPSWSPIDSVELETPGDPPPEGIGAIRVNRRGRTTGRDQILELVPNRRIAYATLSGLPIRDYVGEVDLEPAPGGGTTIRWHSSFLPKPRGTGRIMQLGLRRFLQQTANGLAEYAATASDTQTPPSLIR